MGANKRLKCRSLRQRQFKKFKNQMALSKTTTIESNSNPQFVIVTFEFLKEKTLSRITTFAKHTSLGISLTEKLNLSFFPHKHYFDLKLSNPIESNVFVKISRGLGTMWFHH